MAAKIGLTGGIGSGKSSVGKLFSVLGVTVIDADQIARKVSAPGTVALKQIEAHFGNQCIQPDGALNRKALGEIVFGNPAEKEWLEQLLHPLIRQETDQQVAMVDDNICILEIPLLLETGRHDEMDAVIVIHCDQAIRRQRLINSRQMTPETIQEIFDSQASDEARLAIADYVIDNNGELSALKPQVQQVFNQLTQRF